eukprot:CAMPEP_0171312452 /NCGR_PEP_ID=MMETSP0816-20121228/22685_1 /TAXON_ID=420281 /ORGANISM="Proboscia inermis, Strain CCAP1064/1" /LENGTH=514 /DNA_ID=CAMNT_0011797813 /DNA_START=59 /DNA_END=1603 /DNA_ORIENTATION=-
MAVGLVPDKHHSKQEFGILPILTKPLLSVKKVFIACLVVLCLLIQFITNNLVGTHNSFSATYLESNGTTVANTTTTKMTAETTATTATTTNAKSSGMTVTNNLSDASITNRNATRTIATKAINANQEHTHTQHIDVATNNSSDTDINISTTTTNDQQNQTKMSSPVLCTEIEGTALVHAYNDDDSYPKTAPAFVPLSTLVRGLKTPSKNDTAAVCNYHCNIHFPHFMQEIIRCFSFWRSRPDLTPVLLVQRHQWSRFLLNPTALKEKSRFIYGIVEGLKQAIGLQIVKTYDGASVTTQTFLEKDHIVSPYSMRSRQDAIELRDIFVHMMTNQSSSSSSPSNLLKKEKKGHDQNKDESLQITFINRGGQKRSILNADGILTTLQEAFPQHQVVLQYFEDSSFEEQIELYSQSDVVIAPHGAQLTGIMFMPPCGAVLELFPHLYHTPYFFSSLANISGLVHASWYVSIDSEVPLPNSLDIHTRLNSTMNNICPTLNRVVSNVNEMIQRHQKCRMNK